MNAEVSRGALLRDALNRPWPVAGSELFSHSGKSANRLDSPKLLWMLLQEAFAGRRITLNSPTLPQLHTLDDSLSLSHKILNRLAFVDLYYEQLQQHAYLDTELLDLLHQLRPAIIRSVLHSDTFIASSRHPLRIVVDDLCTWGIGWDKSIGKSGEKYFNLLTNLVAIGNSLAEDAGEFPDAYATTLNVLSDLVARYKQLEERVCDAEQAAMGNLATRRQVEAIINEYVADKPMPATAIAFFHGVWCDILHRLKVLHKENEPEWTEALQVMDQLVFCLAPQPNSRQEQINLIPGLIQYLKRVMQKSGYDASSSYLVDDIIASFKHIMTGESLTLLMAPSLSSLNVAGVSTSISSAIAQEASQLNIGQWILYKGDNGEMSRGRVARIFPEAGQVLLVNLLGARPLSKNMEELGLALNTRRAYLLVSRELSSILLSLTVDLFIKHYQKAIPAEVSSQAENFKKQSAEKALAEAQRLRTLGSSASKPAAPAVPLAEEESVRVEAMVHSLKIGSWLSMKNRIGEQVPCKIAVIYASTGKMVITDKAGLRVGEFLRPELVQLMMKGEASIIEIADSFEGSLSRVLQTLRKNP
jgi:hypothetical protein